MVCSIADNRPLKKLEKELNLPPRCHGKRRECIQGFETHSGDFVMGLPGTALGYCQALFGYAGAPGAHTEKVMRLLEEIEAPWSYSHELFWGHRQGETAEGFIDEGIKPLLGDGRVPILITALDPGENRRDLEVIMETSPAVPKNETVLVRTILTNEASLREITDVLRRLVAQARAKETMPKWWPLLQGNLSVWEWSALRVGLGADWDYVNVAVNPFVSADVFDLVREQITVAQIPVGPPGCISTDGRIQIPREMRVTGAIDGASYSLFEFTSKLQSLPMPPTLIILGPAQAGWTDLDNQKRLGALLPQLRRACDVLWKSLPAERRDEVWKLSA